MKPRSRCPNLLLSFAGSILLPLLIAQAAGQTPYAKAVVAQSIGNGSRGNSNREVNNALGATDGRSVSLGNLGSYVILDMGNTPIVDGPGPDMRVTETDGGDFAEYRVSISNSLEPDNFITIGTGVHVTLFDIAGSGIASARYIRIEDLGLDADRANTPGAEIDSVTAFHHGGLPPAPTGFEARATVEGIYKFWEPPSGAVVHGYRLLSSTNADSPRIITGRFSSEPSSTATSDFSAPRTNGQPFLRGVDFWYAVSTITPDLAESEPTLAHVSPLVLSLSGTNAIHLGDEEIATWEMPAPLRDARLDFALDRASGGERAVLTFESFSVKLPNNQFTVNGTTLTPRVPVQPSEAWTEAYVSFLPKWLIEGKNSIVISARDAAGGATGNLDDFMIRNVKLYVLPTGNVAALSELPWAVSFSPTLPGADWQIVSEPIRWKPEAGGTVTPEGFLRLERLP